MLKDISNTSERGCCWHFEPESGQETGPNDAMMQNFKAKPYSALIREAVQNSLDAVFDRTKPVCVKIEFKSFNSKNFSAFFELRDHVIECRDYYSWHPKANDHYSYMARNLSVRDRNCETMPYILVSDTNTKGMAYEPNDTKSPFYAFARAGGVSAKIDQQSGGSFGFGKSAYFQLSTISTVFISTRTVSNQYVFEGVSWLCTHKHGGEVVSSVGFYDNNGGKPIVNKDLIPNRFLRSEVGTSFFILGYDKSNEEDMQNEMVQETLRSFWLAIYRGKLEVSIGDIVINRESLAELMLNVFDEEHDNHRKNSLLNPRPYFEAVSHADTIKHARCFEHTSDLLGKCSVYLIKNKEAKDKIVYMRRPLMLVYCKRTGTSYGAYGVFVCDNLRGDQLLRELENPAHDEWKVGNWRDHNNKKVPEGEKALDEIQAMISTSLEEFFADASETALAITGLDEYLYIPEDLIDDEQSDHELGQPIGEFKEDGQSLSTDILKDCRQREEEDLANVGSVKIIEAGSQDPLDLDGDEEPYGTGGHSIRRAKVKGGKPMAGRQVSTATIVNEDGTHRIHIPVTFRVCAQNEKGRMYHNIIVRAPHNIENGEIEIVTIGEQSDDVVDIVYSNHGSFDHNTITNLRLKAGPNTIQVLFSDNMRHAIKLKAYENK